MQETYLLVQSVDRSQRRSLILAPVGGRTSSTSGKNAAAVFWTSKRLYVTRSGDRWYGGGTLFSACECCRVACLSRREPNVATSEAEEFSRKAHSAKAESQTLISVPSMKHLRSSAAAAEYPKIRRIRDPVFGNTVEQIRDFPYKGLNR